MQVDVLKRLCTSGLSSSWTLRQAGPAWPGELADVLATPLASPRSSLRLASGGCVSGGVSGSGELVARHNGGGEDLHRGPPDPYICVQALQGLLAA